MAKEATTERPSRSVNIPASLYERLVKESERRDVSVTFLVTRSVERILPAWESVDLDALFPSASAVSDGA